MMRSTFSLPCIDSPKKDTSILKILEALKNDFFRSIQSIDSTADLQSFGTSWSAFSEILNSCTGSLSEETLDLVHNFASTVNTVSLGLLELESEAADICHRVTDDFSTIIAEELGHMDIRSADSPGTVPQAPYLEVASKWLLSNLHDPYPTKTFKSALAARSGAHVKDIDAWFADCRKRIGWNSLRRRRFNNKRADIVRSASRFFKQDDRNPLEDTLENEFVAVMAKAEELCNKFEQSELATKLDHAVKDLTPDMKASTETMRHCRQTEKRKTGRIAYPTPERSPGSSPEPCLPSPPSMPLSLSVPCRKRPHSPSAEEDVTSLYTSKRPRNENSLQRTGLLSPASSLHSDLEEQCSTTELVSHKRKRRLSESMIEPKTKRPHHLSPRPQCVSDSFTSPTPPILPSAELSFASWLGEHLGALPGFSADLPPVSIEFPHPDEILDIQLCDFSQPTDAIHHAERRSEEPLATATESAGAQPRPPFGTPSPLQVDIPNMLTGFDENWFHSLPLGSIDTGITQVLSPSTNVAPGPHSSSHGFSCSSDGYFPDFPLSPEDWTSYPAADYSHAFKSCLDQLPFELSSLPHICPAPTTPLTSTQKEMKKQQIAELESKLLAIRAEIGELS